MMSRRPPSELVELLRADGQANVQQAWERFIRMHHPLLLEVTRALDGEYDASMDRYAFVLDKLRADDFRRLRSYQADGRAKFTTWLTVVAKRLCVDHHRHRYGRPQGAGADTEPGQAADALRRRLADLAGYGQVEDVGDTASPGADADLMHRELLEALDQEVAALSERERLLLTLRFEDGATAREIRDTMGYPSQGHVYRSLDRLSRQLREALQARGFGDGR